MPPLVLILAKKVELVMIAPHDPHFHPFLSHPPPLCGTWAAVSSAMSTNIDEAGE